MGNAFSLGGPYSPEQAAAAADEIAELVRYLNHASGGSDALSCPGDIDRLLSALAVIASRLPQLFMQLQSNLARVTAQIEALAEVAQTFTETTEKL